ncbi:MAG TPA: T9SS type A sorting domain-containing protein [Flavitalea sp.]|nr:T9SS type A sorting domain-containing protein [Flavitalea sp.]
MSHMYKSYRLSLIAIALLVFSFGVNAQTFNNVTPLTPTSTSVSAATGEKPQSKVWTYDGKWFAVFASGGNTILYRLDGTSWTNILTVASGNSHADCKVVGNLTHILVYKGVSSSLVSLEYVPATSTYQLWSIRPSATAITLDASVETATIDVDENGRMWLASDGSNTVNVRWSDAPYSSWSGPVVIANNINSDDISAIIALPGSPGKIGVLWSNQSSAVKRFGFKTIPVDADPSIPGNWSADEVPASQSAIDFGVGMADDHLNMKVASDGTLYCAVKTSYDNAAYPTIALLVRRPSGVWDDLYNVTTGGTRPIVILNETLGKLKVVYTSSESGGNIVYKESSASTISLGAQAVLITGSYNNATSAKQNYSEDIVILASSGSQVVGALASDNNQPPVIPAAPTLESPANAATGIVIPPTLSWNSVPEADSYHIQVALTNDFNAPVYNQSGITANSVSPGGLLSNTQYYWRVSASNAAGAGEWSSIRTFSTIEGQPSSLVAHWTMEEASGPTLIDASGNNNNATIVGDVVRTAGIMGQAISLDGSGDYATVDHSASLNMSTAITLAAWIKPEIQGTQRIIFKVSGSTGYELFLANPNPQQFSVRFNGNASLRVNSTSSYLDFLNTWVHVAATYDGATIRLYINGQLESSLASVFSIASNTNKLGIGATHTGADDFKGGIDDARIYNTALSAAQIQALMETPPAAPALLSPVNGATNINLNPALNWQALPGGASYQAQLSTSSDFSAIVYDQAGIGSPSAEPSGLTANTLYYWRVRATTGSETSDWSETWNFTTGSSPGGNSLVGRWEMDEPEGSTFIDISGYDNHGAINSGSPVRVPGKSGQALSVNGSQHIIVPDAASLDISDKISLSAWIRPTTTGTQYIIKKAVQSATNGYELALANSGKVFFRLNQQTSGNDLRIDSETDYPSDGNTWMHIAATFNGTILKLYINGVLEAEKTVALTTISLNDLPLAIGAQSNGTVSFNGAIDDARVYNTALSGAEILALTIPAPVLLSPLHNATGVAVSPQLSWNASDGAVSYQAQVSTAADFSTTVYDENLTQTNADVSGLLNSSVYYWRIGAIDASDIIRWSETRSFTTADAAPTTNDNGPGYSLYFDGSNDYITIPDNDNLDLTLHLTMEGWIKPAKAATQRLIRKATHDSVNGYELSLSSPTADQKQKFFVRFNQQSSGESLRVNSVTEYEVGAWAHVAATYDGAVINLYVNGILESSKAATAPVNINTLPLTFGAQITGTEYPFEGELDEIRIWNIARTQEEIRSDMNRRLTGNEPGLVGYWRFNETQGPTVYDQTTNQHNGVMTNMDPATAKRWSGAAVGEVSVNDYDLAEGYNASLSHPDGDHISVTATAGSINGLQVYLANDEPVREGSTIPDEYSVLSPRYWGVKLIGTDDPAYTLTYNYEGHPDIIDERTLRLLKRSDHSDGNWIDAEATLNMTDKTLAITGAVGTEYVLASSNAALPITLGPFTAKTSGKNILVQWQTTMESNNAGFYLERSTDGIHFSNLAFIPSKTSDGNSVSNLFYSYTDVSPVSGANYYRLKQEDHDGAVNYSPVVSVRLNKDIINTLGIYPNPVTNEMMNVSFQSGISAAVVLSVTDLSGRMLSHRSVAIRPGENVTQINTGSLKPGLYLLRLTTPGNGKSFIRSFIKQ